MEQEQFEKVLEKSAEVVKNQILNNKARIYRRYTEQKGKVKMSVGLTLVENAEGNIGFDAPFKLSAEDYTAKAGGVLDPDNLESTEEK